MLLNENDFIFFPLADLQALKTQYQTCLLTIAQAHQSYSIANRTFNRAQLPEVRKTLGQINMAIAYLTNGLSRGVRVKMNRGGCE